MGVKRTNHALHEANSIFGVSSSRLYHISDGVTRLQVLQARYISRFPGSDFEALLEYGADIGPDYRAWGELIAAEGPAIEAALGDNPEALCTTHIAGDIPDMQALLNSFQAVNAPDAANDVHEVVVTGANAWLLGLENSDSYCTATTDWEKALYLAAAKVTFGMGLTAYGGALAQYTDALQQAWREMWR